MAEKLYYAIFETRFGWVGILGGKSGIRSITLPYTDRRKIIDYWGKLAHGAILSSKFFGDLPFSLQDYYAGEKAEFPVELDFSGCTPFQKQVWEAARRIPRGETRSYGQLANQIGNPKAARAVGSALGKNPFLIIVPCHRVIAANGGLGGFGGGLELKKKLLDLEKKS